jgi:hypothetical protein
MLVLEALILFIFYKKKKMKQFINTGALIAALIVVVLLACNKNSGDNTVRTDDFTNNAVVKVYNGSLSTTRNYVYVDGKPVTGAQVAYGAVFPAGASTYGFLVQPGVRAFTIKDTLGTSTQPVLTFAQNFDPGKSYTVFMYDTVTAIKQVTVPTDVTPPAEGTAKVRFGHFAYLKAGVPSPVDVFSVVKNANIFSSVAYTQVTDFIPFTAGISDTLVVRQAGSTTVNLDTLRGFNPSNKRIYTLVFGGRYMTNEAGGATLPRTLTSFVTY